MGTTGEGEQSAVAAEAKAGVVDLTTDLVAAGRSLTPYQAGVKAMLDESREKLLRTSRAASRARGDQSITLERAQRTAIRTLIRLMNGAENEKTKLEAAQFVLSHIKDMKTLGQYQVIDAMLSRKQVASISDAELEKVLDG